MSLHAILNSPDPIVIKNLNQDFFRSHQALQASALVGRTVFINSNIIKLQDVDDVLATIDLPAGFSRLRAFIYNHSGDLIKIILIGNSEPGFYQFKWDGNDQENKRSPSGSYRVKVTGIYDGQELSLNTMIAANVNSVSLGKNGAHLMLHVAGIGVVSIDQVRLF